MPISKEKALEWIEGNHNTLFPKPLGRLVADSLYISCVKWDPELREEPGNGQCAMCNRYRMVCKKCPLSNKDHPGVHECCCGRYMKWEDSDTTRKEKIWARKTFEFIKAKYKEVSGKDYV